MDDKQPGTSSDLERIADAVSGKSQDREQEPFRHFQMRIDVDGDDFPAEVTGLTWTCSGTGGGTCTGVAVGW